MIVSNMFNVLYIFGMFVEDILLNPYATIALFKISAWANRGKKCIVAVVCCFYSMLCDYFYTCIFAQFDTK